MIINYSDKELVINFKECNSSNNWLLYLAIVSIAIALVILINTKFSIYSLATILLTIPALVFFIINKKRNRALKLLVNNDTLYINGINFFNTKYSIPKENFSGIGIYKSSKNNNKLLLRFNRKNENFKILIEKEISSCSKKQIDYILEEISAFLKNNDFNYKIEDIQK